MKRKTFVYIDGFNLYYGAVKGTPYKWLDLSKLCDLMLAQNEVVRIKYFSARVSARTGDPDAPTRQDIYWRALRTIPNLEIFEGQFLTHVKSAPVAHPKPGRAPFVEIINTQEKGSDVNLASQLLLDAFKNRFEVAVVVSNDSDLFMPIKIVRDEFKKTVGIINPQKKPSRHLLKVKSFYKPIRETELKLAQFPPVLTDFKGSFHKPKAW